MILRTHQSEEAESNLNFPHKVRVVRKVDLKISFFANLTVIKNRLMNVVLKIESVDKRQILLILRVMETSLPF